ncbi:NADP-dependent oxidoreductase [Streptomyces sp. HNM0574]|uniref:MDR family NADP-dependent oxidoreductase n=1 Tax=Streptomyces sp. HNM0574 TaxID=2714954 RepID=UPI00146CA2E4|nr:NADP-dependent oxidoreductase [Streptomyces sp. HNM0574]NLU68547.1 NADP-dependent oxidoreductase [Streptomyces sp. HNM0574]
MQAAVPATHTEIRLARRPTGPLGPEHFRQVRVPVPDPGPGGVLVRNRMMAVTSVMRTLMEESSPLPIPEFRVGETMMAPTVGEVITPGDSGLRPGQLVLHHAGWREWAVPEPDDVQPLNTASLPDPAAHLSQSFASWVAVVRGAEVRPGDTVFVSGAAGGVGVMAGQFARLHGAGRVIGSVGSQAKADFVVRELGYDAAVLRNAGEGTFEERLRAAAPDGIDAVVDNVGGEQLGAAVRVARHGARISVFGTLAEQGGGSALTEIDTGLLIGKGIVLRGTLVFDHTDVIPDFEAALGKGLEDGSLAFPHNRFTGVEEAPRALRELLAGKLSGSVLVEL